MIPQTMIPAVDNFRAQHKDTLDSIERKFQSVSAYLPFFARLFTVLTFYDDGFRILMSPMEQTNFITMHITGYSMLSSLFAVLFVLGATFSQLVGATLILLNKRVDIGASLLASFLFVSIFLFGLAAPDWVHAHGSDFYIIRLVGQIGALAMLAAAEQIQLTRSNAASLAGLPSIVDPLEWTHRLQFMGRVLICVLCIAVFRHGVISGIITCAVGVMVAAGFKTKLATTLIAFLFSMSMFATHSFDSYATWDTVTYVLCQDLSIFGGLLVLMQNGPGEISYDKKH